MTSKNKKTLLFSIIGLLIILLNFFSIENPDKLPYYSTRPLFLFSMTIMYLIVVTKPIWAFSCCQVFIFIAEFLQYYRQDFFPLAIASYTLALLFLIKAVLSFSGKIKLKDFIVYLLFYLLFFTIVFVTILDKNVNKVFILIYGGIFIISATMIFVNFLKKMTKANFLLFLGVLISSISNIIISINITNVLSDKPVLLIVTLTTFASHYLVSLGFVYKEDEILN